MNSQSSQCHDDSVRRGRGFADNLHVLTVPDQVTAQGHDPFGRIQPIQDLDHVPFGQPQSDIDLPHTPTAPGNDEHRLSTVPINHGRQWHHGRLRVQIQHNPDPGMHARLDQTARIFHGDVGHGH